MRPNVGIEPAKLGSNDGLGVLVGENGELRMEKFEALKKAKALERHYPSDYWGNDNPRCPHCGQECKVADNEWWKLYEEGEHEVSCPHCDGDFSVSTRVSYSFSTDEQEDA